MTWERPDVYHNKIVFQVITLWLWPYLGCCWVNICIHTACSTYGPFLSSHGLENLFLFFIKTMKNNIKEKWATQIDLTAKVVSSRECMSKTLKTSYPPLTVNAIVCSYLVTGVHHSHCDWLLIHNFLGWKDVFYMTTKDTEEIFSQIYPNVVYNDGRSSQALWSEKAPLKSVFFFFLLHHCELYLQDLWHHSGFNPNQGQMS